jgi:hypothetical protein
MATEQTNPVKPDKAPAPPVDERFNIAKWVLIFGLVAVSVLGILAIVFSAIWGEDDQIFSNVKDILVMILPLIGAWVGTVLAFYFSKENFKAASDSTRDLFRAFKSTEEKLEAIRVADVMIKAEAMVMLILDKDEKLIKLKADIIDGILEKDKDKQFNRLPVLTDKMYPKYIIHRSLFDKYFVKMTLAASKLEDLTLADMSGDSELGNLLAKSFGTIKESSNLAEVKHLIDNVPNCQDVFVTENGDPNSKVIGWITNVIVAKASVV